MPPATPTAAAIATLERLLAVGGEDYERLEAMGEQLASGLAEALRRRGVTVVVAREGSALCVYLWTIPPADLVRCFAPALERAGRCCAWAGVSPAVSGRIAPRVFNSALEA